MGAESYACATGMTVSTMVCFLPTRMPLCCVTNISPVDGTAENDGGDESGGVAHTRQSYGQGRVRDA
jgi:hypothetical protein